MDRILLFAFYTKISSGGQAHRSGSMQEMGTDHSQYLVDWLLAPASSPTQLIVTQVFQTSLQLRWTNTHDDGVDHFNVYCYHTSCPYCSHLPAVHTVTTSSTIATVTGLTPFTEYECCVTAINLNQESDCSEELNISTLPGDCMHSYVPFKGCNAPYSTPNEASWCSYHRNNQHIV